MGDLIGKDLKMSQKNQKVPTQRVKTLLARHHSIELELKRELNRPSHNHSLIVELKRRKLKVKDQLAELGALSVPQKDDNKSVLSADVSNKKERLIGLQNHRSRFAPTVAPSSVELKKLDEDIRLLDTDIAVLELRIMSLDTQVEDIESVAA